MRVIALLLAVLSVSTLPAWSCGGDTATPRGLITDEARIAPLVERIQQARQAWRDVVQARGLEYDRRDQEWRDKRDAAYEELKTRLGKEYYNAPEFQEAVKAFGEEQRDAFMHATPILPDFPAIKVDQTLFLCGSATLEDGHSINAGSYWVFRRFPEIGWDVSGVEMHYLLEHHQATPDLLEKLERFFAQAEPAPAPAPRKASSIDGDAVRSKLTLLTAPAPFR